MPTATVAKDLIEVTPNYREDMQPNPYYLRVSVPDGWNDVKKISKKVLQFEGRNYTFIGWNSDSNLCFFRASHNVAKILKR
jgi:hypothetical protein